MPDGTCSGDIGLVNYGGVGKIISPAKSLVDNLIQAVLQDAFGTHIAELGDEVTHGVGVDHSLEGDPGGILEIGRAHV